MEVAADRVAEALGGLGAPVRCLAATAGSGRIRPTPHRSARLALVERPAEVLAALLFDLGALPALPADRQTAGTGRRAAVDLRAALAGVERSTELAALLGGGLLAASVRLTTRSLPGHAAIRLGAALADPGIPTLLLALLDGRLRAAAVGETTRIVSRRTRHIPARVGLLGLAASVEALLFRQPLAGAGRQTAGLLVRAPAFDLRTRLAGMEVSSDSRAGLRGRLRALPVDTTRRLIAPSAVDLRAGLAGKVLPPSTLAGLLVGLGAKTLRTAGAPLGIVPAIDVDASLARVRLTADTLARLRRGHPAGALAATRRPIDRRRAVHRTTRRRLVRLSSLLLAGLGVGHLRTAQFRQTTRGVRALAVDRFTRVGADRGPARLLTLRGKHQLTRPSETTRLLIRRLAVGLPTRVGRRDGSSELPTIRCRERLAGAVEATRAAPAPVGRRIRRDVRRDVGRGIGRVGLDIRRALAPLTGGVPHTAPGDTSGPDRTIVVEPTLVRERCLAARGQCKRRPQGNRRPDDPSRICRHRTPRHHLPSIRDRGSR